MSLRDYGIVCEDEPDYTISEEEIILEFQTKFQKIKDMGYVKSHRSNNTGIGKTFEDLIGIKENNISNADFGDLIEIKSKRDASNSMVTLFTKSPDHPKKSNRYLRDTYGMVDEDTKLKKLHTTVSGIEYNTFGRVLGFKLIVDSEENKVRISVKNLKADKIFDNNIFYTFDTLRDIIAKKCTNIVFVNADTKIVDGIEYFKFVDAQLLTGLTFDKFLCGITTGAILYDIRIGSYKSGNKKGIIHDHGSGFRIKKNEIPNYFHCTCL